MTNTLWYQRMLYLFMNPKNISTRNKHSKIIYSVIVFILAATSVIASGSAKTVSSGLLKFNLSGDGLYDRPLFGSEPPFVTYGGSLPAFAVSGGWYGGKLGNLFILVETEKDIFLAHKSDKIKAHYDGLSLEYIISDHRIKDGSITVKVLPDRIEKGCLFFLETDKLPLNTNIYWIYGGASGQYDFKYPTNYRSDIPILPFNERDMENNIIEPTKDGFILRGTTGKRYRKDIPDVACPPVSRVFVEPTSDICFIKNIFSKTSTVDCKEVLCKIVALKNAQKGQSYLRIIEGDSPQTISITKSMEISLREGLKLLSSFNLNTPYDELNLVSQLVVPAYRASWWNNNGTHLALHGATAWAAPLIGWRVLYGAVVLGWNDFLSEDFLAYGQNQGTTEDSRTFKNLLISDKWGYNMDEVFIHQLFYYYAWSGDKDLIRILWPNVEKNLQFRKEKFDPDHDSLYTNWLNTWISDYHWYLGGKCIQSSAYHFDAWSNMAKTAQLCDRTPAPFENEAMKIARAVNDELWLDDQGVFAEYKDTLGLERVHRAVELPSIYTPIEVGLASTKQAERMVAFVRDTFEHIETPNGGLIPYSSPWKPTEPSGILHSSRSICPDEALHMALAAYKAGYDDYAFKMLRGVCYSVTHSMTAKGSFCNWVDEFGRGERHPDFADTTSMFLRTVSEGLFGIEPHVPDGKVNFRPRFPRQWSHAALSTAGFSVEFKGSDLTESYSFKTSKALDYSVCLPLRYEKIESVQVNGKPGDYTVDDSLVTPRVFLNIPGSRQAGVTVKYVRNSEPPRPKLIKAPSLESFLAIPENSVSNRENTEAVIYNLQPYFNVELEKIFKKSYSSEEMKDIHWLDIRKNTCSRWDFTEPKPSMAKLLQKTDPKGFFLTEKSKTSFQVSTDRKNILLLGRWDELPNKTQLPVNMSNVREVCLLITGRTYPMQSHIANARIVLNYKNGQSQSTDLINPYNYDDGIGSFGYYHYSANEMVELGEKAHADIVSIPVKSDTILSTIELECLSDQIVFGVLAVTLYVEPALSTGTYATDEQWVIDSQQEWEKYTSNVSNLEVKDGFATPTDSKATFKSSIKSFKKKRSAKSIMFEQSPYWKGWTSVAPVRPSNLGDAPVFLSIGPNNYWMFGRYLDMKKNNEFTSKSVKLKGFDIELRTTPDPHQFDAPGGLLPGLGGYHAWQSRDMINWVHHGNVTEKFSQWVTTAEYVDGKFYIYYDYPNDQDPHLYIDEDLTDGKPGKNMGMVFRDLSNGSDCGVIRDQQGLFHLIYEDWSSIDASKHAWDSPIAGHAVSPDGIKDFEILSPAVDHRTKPTGKIGTYKHPHWLKEDPDNYKTSIGEYEIHEPKQDAYGDWAPICVGGQYYLFGDFHPTEGHMGLGCFTSTSLYKPFTRYYKIGQGHPDPDIGFAEGRFYLVTQMDNDFVSPGPWVERVSARVGVDTDNDGEIDTWTNWTEVKETYDHMKGYTKIIKKTPAAIDLSVLPDGCAFQFEFNTARTTDNGVLPVMDNITMIFE